MTTLDPLVQVYVDVHRDREHARNAAQRYHAEAAAALTATREAIASIPKIETRLQRELVELRDERARRAWDVLAGVDDADSEDIVLVEKLARVQRHLELVPVAMERLTWREKDELRAVARLVRD